MRKIFWVLALFSIAALFSNYSYATGAYDDMSAVNVDVMRDNQDGLTVSISFDRATLRINGNNGDQQPWLDIPGTVPNFDEQGPIVPTFSKFIAVPNGYKVEARIVDKSNYAIALDPAVHRDANIRQGRNIHAQLPEVEVGDPVWIRYMRVAPVVIRPGNFNAHDHAFDVADRMEVEFTFVRDDNFLSDQPDPERYWSLDFANFFDAMLLNPRDVPIPQGGRLIRRGSYVIITDQALARHTTEFADWKRKKGFNVVVESMVDANTTTADIQDYLRDAWANWDRPPEYVLLIGDENAPGIELPAFRILNPLYAGENDVTDLPYVLLQGDDYFPDAFIGRISVDSPTPGGVRNALYRARFQDMTPRLNDPDWYHRATLFGGNYGEGDRPISSPVETLKWLGFKLRHVGFDVEEFYYENPNDDISPNPIVASINRGINILAYRGWADARGTHYPQFYKDDLDRLRNGPMLPIGTFFVCNTGDFGNRTYNPCFGEYSLLRGVEGDPKGFLAFYGPSDLHTSTQFNNPNLAGYYAGMLDGGLRTLGPLTLAAKTEIWNGYPAFRNQGGENNVVEFYFHVYNILGDPDQTVFVDPPHLLDVEHVDALKIGDSHARVVVSGENGAPIHHALVTLIKGEETDVAVMTDNEGVAELPIRLDSAGDLFITVLAYQAYPYRDTIAVSAPDNFVGVESYRIMVDDNEVSDVPVNTPFELVVSVRNTGQNAANGVTATISSPIDEIMFTDNASEYGDIAAGNTADPNVPFTISVPGNLAEFGELPFVLTINDSQNREYSGLLRLPTSAPLLQYVEHEIEGGVINPGETKNINLTIANHGTMNITGLQASIHSFDEAISVTDADAVFGDLNMGDEIDCAGNQFEVQVMDDTYEGREIQLRAVFTNSDGDYVGRVYFNIVVGTVGPSNPLGPDGYGYFAYEDTDAVDMAPEFSWIELDPNHGGQGGTHHAIEDDQIIRMELPFVFMYYGFEYLEITICDNGWLSFGDTRGFTYSSWHFRNWPMPSPLGVPSMVAPFWDDLINQDGEGNRIPNNVYTRYDENEGRFIIEWSRSLARSGAEVHEETFEVILFDPAQHETETGDGEILFQYETVNLVDNGREQNFATVGIENWNHQYGLQVTFANRMSPACGDLEDGRAIKFTTNSPDEYNHSKDNNVIQPVTFELGQPYPNPFNAVTSIGYSLPSSSQIHLSVWDLNGRFVNTLVKGSVEAGNHKVTFDAKELPSGLYIVRLEAGSAIAQKKLLLLK